MKVQIEIESLDVNGWHLKLVGGHSGKELRVPNYAAVIKELATYLAAACPDEPKVAVIVRKRDAA